MSIELKPHILIVDDDQSLTTVLKLMLTGAGFDAEAVHSGQAALNWLNARTPDVMLLDLMMPDMTGLAVLRQLRETGELNKVPVIVLTARTDTRSQRESRAAGASAILTKPVGRDRLVKLVREVVNHAPVQ